MTRRQFFLLIAVAGLIPVSSSRADPSAWGTQTWTHVETTYDIYQKDIVYGDGPFLIDDSRDGKTNYETRALSIFRPAADGALLENRPVVFYVHGGGWTDGYRDQHSYMSLSFTGEKGWVTVVIDYRLTANEVTLAGTAEKAAWYPDNIEDVADAFRWVRDNIAGNGGRTDMIFDFGHSAGGHLALLLAVHPDYLDLRSSIRGVVAMSPPYDLDELDKWAFCTVFNQTFPGGCYDNQTELDEASPATYITGDATLPPIHALYCELDLPSLPEQSQQLVETLRSLDRISYIDYLEGYNHVSEISAFTDADSEPAVLVVNFMERLMQTPSLDFDGDGTAEIAVFRGTTGLWAVRDVSRVYFGGSGDSPVPRDYSGNGTMDIAVFRPSSGLWAVKGLSRFYFGSTIDTPVPGDYNGDGTAEIAIFRSVSGLWAIRGISRLYFGNALDEPVPGPYRGGITAQIAVFRQTTGLWAIRGVSRAYFGWVGDRAVPGDYAWNGRWTPGIYRSTAGLWAIRDATRAYFGELADTPVPADYDGDLRDDISIFRRTAGLWAIRGISRFYFGSVTDTPVTR